MQTDAHEALMAVKEVGQAEGIELIFGSKSWFDALFVNIDRKRNEGSHYKVE